MSVFLQPIYTQTVASGSPTSVIFYNVPQTFTDLMLVASVRSTNASVSVGCGVTIFDPNFVSSSGTKIEGNGSSVYSQRYGTGTVPGANATANTFGSFSYYLPNYKSSNFKQGILDAVMENNATESYQSMAAHLTPTTNPISIVQFSIFSGNLAINSTFSLYGVLRAGI